MSTTTAMQTRVTGVRRSSNRRVPVPAREFDGGQHASAAPAVVCAFTGPAHHHVDWPPLLGFGRALRAERERRGWSLTQLAERARVAPEDLYAIEVGDLDPTFCTICAIAHSLLLRPTRLVELGEEETTWMLGGIPF